MSFSKGRVSWCVYLGCITIILLFVLQHHCRNCGKSVCGSCSGNTIALPHYNMQNPVRVCDVCFRKVKSGAPIVKYAVYTIQCITACPDQTMARYLQDTCLYKKLNRLAYHFMTGGYPYYLMYD